MAVTYPLNIPTEIGIEGIRLRAVNAVSTSQSPFTFRQQVISHQGQRWEADIRIPRVNRPEAEAWIAFLMKLKGQIGTFLLGDPSGKVPRGSASTTAGTPVFDLSGSDGSVMALSGLPVSTTGYLLPGDYIQLGTGNDSKLYKVLDSVDSDGSGNTSFEVWPDLVSKPADGSSVIVSDAKGLFRLSRNLSEWEISSPASYGLSFEAVQAIT